MRITIDKIGIVLVRFVYNSRVRRSVLFRIKKDLFTLLQAKANQDGDAFVTFSNIRICGRVTAIFFCNWFR